MPFQVEPEALAEAGDRPGVGPRRGGCAGGGDGSDRGEVDFPGGSGLRRERVGWLRCAQLAWETTKLLELEMLPIRGSLTLRS